MFALLPETPAFFRRTITIERDRSIVGRMPECHIVIGDGTISRRHAEIVWDGARIQVNDLKSRNGTFVNGRRIESSEVKLGDQLQFGRVGFLVAKGNGVPVEVDGDESTDQCDYPRKENELQVTVETLSPAEGRIFEFLVEGLAEKQIASQLRISRHTVHNHVKAIYRQFGVHSRPELLARLLQGGSEQTS